MDAESLPKMDELRSDPNDQDDKESVFEFIHREFPRLTGKVPAEFEAEGFRISFVATTDRPEYPIQTYFVVAAVVKGIGEASMRGRNPFEATMGLIDGVYKEYAKLYQRQQEEERARRRVRDEQYRAERARQSLIELDTEAIADMADGQSPLPVDATMDMVQERAKKIAMETVRGLSDSELQQAEAPSYLSETERQLFAKRCASEMRSRVRLHEMLVEHHESWPQRKDDYPVLLQIWNLCARHTYILEEVLFAFFYGDERPPSGGDPTLEKLLIDAPRIIKTIRRQRAITRREELDALCANNSKRLYGSSRLEDLNAPSQPITTRLPR